jgi:hypothetical protein
MQRSITPDVALRDFLRTADDETRNAMSASGITVPEDLCDRILAKEKATAIIESCENIVDAIEECVHSCHLGAELQHSNGLSVYFPWSLVSYALTRPLYTKLRLSDPESPWVAFLETYLSMTLRLPNVDSGDRRYLFVPCGEAFNESDKEYFELNRFGGLPLGVYDRLKDKLGQPVGKLGQPVGKLGQPVGKLGQPVGKLGQPVGKLGQPVGKLGQPVGKLGQPVGKLGHPVGKLDGSDGSDGWPNVKLNPSEMIFMDPMIKGFGASGIGNFGKTKNFPWAPRLWHPSKCADSDCEDKVPKEATSEETKVNDPAE